MTSAAFADVIVPVYPHRDYSALQSMCWGRSESQINKQKRAMSSAKVFSGQRAGVGVGSHSYFLRKNNEAQKGKQNSCRPHDLSAASLDFWCLMCFPRFKAEFYAWLPNPSVTKRLEPVKIVMVSGLKEAFFLESQGLEYSELPS